MYDGETCDIHIIFMCIQLYVISDILIYVPPTLLQSATYLLLFMYIQLYFNQRHIYLCTKLVITNTSSTVQNQLTLFYKINLKSDEQQQQQQEEDEIIFKLSCTSSNLLLKLGYSGGYG